MKSSDLINIINKKYPYLSMDEVKVIINAIFDYIKLELKNGNKIEIREFGVFKARIYKSKHTFNPKTLEYNDIGERLIPAYRASIILKKRINQ